MFDSTILIDNIADGALTSEWGFSIYIEYNGKKYLLDAGGSNMYLENAKKLGIDIGDVDMAILSHAHYDHSGGFGSFFEVNSKASLFVAQTCSSDCYFKLGPIRKFVGFSPIVMDENRERINHVSGMHQLDEGVYLVPHLQNGLEEIGKRAHMYRKLGNRVVPDDFSHEQSLVFETEKGLVVLNSCSHGGLQNILADINHYLPGKSVYMTIGGMHLAASSNKMVRSVADTISGLSIEKVITGHCTGKRAYNILEKELGDKLMQMHVGMKISV